MVANFKIVEKRANDIEVMHFSYRSFRVRQRQRAQDRGEHFLFDEALERTHQVEDNLDVELGLPKETCRGLILVYGTAEAIRAELRALILRTIFCDPSTMIILRIDQTARRIFAFVRSRWGNFSIPEAKHQAGNTASQG